MRSHPQLEEWKLQYCAGTQDTVQHRCGDSTAPLPRTIENAIDLSPNTPFSTLLLSPIHFELDIAPRESTSGIDLVEPEALMGLMTAHDEHTTSKTSRTRSWRNSPRPGTPAAICAASPKRRSLRPRPSNNKKPAWVEEDSLEEHDTATGRKAQQGRTRRSTTTTTNAAARVSKQTAIRASVDQVFVAVPTGASYKCACKKSKCLKLYCECFANGVLCDDKCYCAECSNTADNVAARRKAVAKKLQRRPDAFGQKIRKDTRVKDGAIHAQGCKCKRSHCQKKYCECFQGGVSCTEACQCLNCANQGGELLHLRDLGVQAWQTPAGGFQGSAKGVMETITLPGADEEEIPPCEAEIELDAFLQYDHKRRLKAAAKALRAKPRERAAAVATTSDDKQESATLWVPLQPAVDDPMFSAPLRSVRVGPEMTPTRSQKGKRVCRKVLLVPAHTLARPISYMHVTHTLSNHPLTTAMLLS